MPKEELGYSKKVITKVEKVSHTIRFNLNTLAGDLYSMIKQVPPEAVVVMVTGDDANRDAVAEIIFEETNNLE